jgi:hypothetical protein
VYTAPIEATGSTRSELKNAFGCNFV